VAAAVAGFVGGVSVSGSMGGSSDGSSEARTPPRVATPAVVERAGRGALSRAGALSAAAESTTLLTRMLPMDADEARRVAADVASDAYRAVLVAAVDTELLPLQWQMAGLPGPLHRQSVLASRMESYAASSDMGRARVSVWLLFTVGLNEESADGAAERTNAVGRFVTVSVDLVWQRGQWRLDAVTQRPGPTPLLDGAPQTARDFAAALAGFADWRPA
jgi:hypothetical protein